MPCAKKIRDTAVLVTLTAGALALAAFLLVTEPRWAFRDIFRISQR